MKTVSNLTQTLSNTFLFFILTITFSPFNFAQEVQIGNQIWHERNLDVTNFRNGDEIPEVKTGEEWARATENEQPAWCYYENDSLRGQKRGKLYNWYAVNDKRGLAPKGWRVPKLFDFQVLYAFYDVASSPEKEEAQFEKAMLFIERLKSDFENTKNDSLFAYHHSDYFDIDNPVTKSVSSSFETTAYYSQEKVDKINGLEMGEVMQFEENNKISLVKLVGFKEFDFVKVRSLYLKDEIHTGGKTSIELADSLLKVILKEDNFSEMIEQFSDDKSAIESGGEYEFGRGVMIKPFNDFSFNNTVGTIDTLTTVYGMYIVEVLNKSSKVTPKVVEVEKIIVKKTTVAHLLKDKNQWKDVPIYLDSDNNFKAILSGIRLAGGEFLKIDEVSAFWTKSLDEENDDLALTLYLLMYLDDTQQRSFEKGYGIPVRCIKN